MTLDSIRAAFDEARQVLDHFMADPQNYQHISDAAHLISHALLNGHKAISCGNGGSMSDAMHFAEELSGRFRNDRRSLASIAISDPAHITCTANDYGFNFVFSRFVEGVGNPGDVLLAISTSGNSANVLNAAQTAIDKGMKVISLTGKDGGKLKAISHVNINVPHFRYSDRIQEIHIKIIHILIELIESLVDEKNS
ncbi:MAG: D-sedoheptulose 7-phosphate isomerase [Breznakibacter sp.]